jgi:glycine dehydrogenase subunit 1
MLRTIGAISREALFNDLPKQVRLPGGLDLPPPLSEPELLEELTSLSQGNSLASSFLGGGNYQHFIPSVVKQLLSRSEFYTAYTPYQAEISQGLLQVIYEYQSLLCSLTGLDVANASLYDGATALVEGAFLACRATGRKEVVVSSTVNPVYRQVLKTYAQGAGLSVKELAYTKEGLTKFSDDSLTPNSACLILQQPNFFGTLEAVSGLADKVHKHGALFVVCANPISLGLLRSPGSYGADVVVGEGQALGNPQSFGGPGLGLFAARQDYVRQMPGRIVGATVDSEGRRGFVLTLSTREQHIRRERATSNVCSNEALCALAAGVYLSIMGKAGLRTVAQLCIQKSYYLKSALAKTTKARLVFTAPSFNEFVIKTDQPVGLDLAPFYPELKNCRLLAVTELTKKAEMDKLWQQLQ